MKEIQLNHGKVALVDDQDYNWLNQWKWTAKYTHNIWYAVRNFWSGKKCIHVKMHRLILGLTDPKIFGDHDNHNGLDNQRHNLRISTPSQNSKNTTSRKNSTSKYLGVCKQMYSYKYTNSKGEIIRKDYGYKWVVSATINGKQKVIKRLPFTPEGEIKAAKLYDKVALEQYGEFTNLNFR